MMTMSSTMDNLTVLTYKSTGLGEAKRTFIGNLLDDCKPQLVFLQETWLLTSNWPVLGNINGNYLFHGTSAVAEGELLKDGPFGGVAIVYPELDACRNAKCDSASHRQSIDSWCEHIVLIYCADFLPKIKQHGNSKIKNVPGWREHVKPFQDDNRWWHWIWTEAGRPRTGVVYESMKRSRNQYMYAVRRVRKNGRNIRYQKMATAAASVHVSDLWGA